MLHDVHTVRHHSSCAAMGVEVTALLLLPTELTPGRTYAVAGLASGELVLADVGRSRGEVLRRWSHLAPHAPMPTPACSTPASASASDSGSGLASGLEGLSFGLAVTCVAADLATGLLFTADEEGGLCAWHVARLLEAHGGGGGVSAPRAWCRSIPAAVMGETCRRRAPAHRALPPHTMVRA